MSATQERGKVLKGDGDRGESGYPEGKRKT